MVKTYKLSNQKSVSGNISAFALYKSGSSVVKSDDLDDAAPPSESGNILTPELDARPTVPTSSFMNKFSHRTMFPFRRSSRKKKKKERKGVLDGMGGNSKASCLTNDAYKQSPLVSGGEKMFVFGKGKFKSTACPNVKPGKCDAPPKIYANCSAAASSQIACNSWSPPRHPPKRVYKDDKSIELSTSRSLTGYEDDDDDGCMTSMLANKLLLEVVVEGSLSQTGQNHFAMMSPPVFDENLDPNSNELVVKSGLEISAEILDESPPPLHKKARMEAELEEVKDVTSATEKMNSKVQTTQKEMGQPSSKQGSPVYAVSATSMMSASSNNEKRVPKMPFPAGNSEGDGKMLLRWLLHPMSDEHFMSNIWEKKPVLVRRRIPSYASGLFSTEEFNRILHECNVQYGVNLDVTSYMDRKRETYNAEGKVFPVVVWDNYKNGCSLRLKNPQAFSKPVWKLCATLQEYFKNMVGANIYLTPSGTQGFAPHYDDIEAFVLQLEGKKHWHLYSPRSPAEKLPRYSSPNFNMDEIGKLIFDVVLEPGDLLYFPRGFIHQAQAVKDVHSLHITISTYQKNTWGDVMEQLVPKAMQRAISENIEFRKGLPLDYLSTMGQQNLKAKPGRRKDILKKISELFSMLSQYAEVDDEADERATDFLHDCLPPALTQDERSRTILGATVRLPELGQPSSCECDINLNTKVRVLRKNALRLVRHEGDIDEDSAYYVYHCTQNPRTYHTEEKKYFAVVDECAPVIEYLISSYPEYKSVASFPARSDDVKKLIASGLFERGLLLLKDKVMLLQDGTGTT